MSKTTVFFLFDFCFVHFLFQGWDDVSFHGSPQIPTPHIDKLANSGVILNSYYVSPICTPTRASIMTGKHPVNLGECQKLLNGCHCFRSTKTLLGVLKLQVVQQAFTKRFLCREKSL